MSGIAALSSWRAGVSRQRIAYGLLAAFVATHMATVSGYWYKIIGIPTLGWPQFNGILLLVHPCGADGCGASATQQFWAGSVYHFLTGICFGLIYVFLIHPLLPLRNTFFGNIGKGLIWGAVLATLSALLWGRETSPSSIRGSSRTTSGGRRCSASSSGTPSTGSTWARCTTRSRTTR